MLKVVTILYDEANLQNGHTQRFPIEEYDSEDLALMNADYLWSHLTEEEKYKRVLLAVCRTVKLDGEYLIDDVLEIVKEYLP